jgi:exodeoxyribonuclease VII small subunit
MENITYEQASIELNDILTEMKNESISIDKLSEKVERAADLAIYCNTKLKTTEDKVSEIIKKLGL